MQIPPIISNLQNLRGNAQNIDFSKDENSINLSYTKTNKNGRSLDISAEISKNENGSITISQTATTENGATKSRSKTISAERVDRIKDKVEIFDERYDNLVEHATAAGRENIPSEEKLKKAFLINLLA